MNTETADNVAKPCEAYTRMRVDWQMIDDLLGGTRAMRMAGERWLPKEEAESDKAYRVRINRSFLYGALRDTMRRLKSKPFSRSVTLAEPLTDRLATFDADVDGQGQDLTQFAAQCFDAAQNRGLVHILVEYPNVALPGETPEQTSQRVTLEVESQIRPYFVLISADDMLGWESETIAGGGQRLTQIRFREWVVEKDGKWGTKRVEQIRVMRRDSWETWRQDSDGVWQPFQSGAVSLREIPLATAYFNRTGYMTAEPPLVELAWLNVAHWCTASDQSHILRFQRFGIIFSRGFSRKDGSDANVIGPARWIAAEEANADMKIVEGTGAALGAGRQDVFDVEARMEVVGLAPLMERTGDATATGRAMDESRTQNDVQAWIRQLEAALLRALEFAHKWVGQEMHPDQSVDIFNEFGISLRASEDIKNLLAMRMAGEITRRTFLSEVRRRAVLADSVDVDVELAEVEAETQLDGTTGLEPPHDHANDPNQDAGGAAGAAA